MNSVKRGEVKYLGSKLEVYSTKDYSIFKPHPGNRAMGIWETPEESSHVAAIKRSMLTKILFTLIVVNKKMQVIDGQHRLAAMKSLGLEIHYIILPDYNGDEMIGYNVAAKVWVVYDYASHYASKGNAEYKRFLVNLEMGVGPSTLLSLTNGTRSFNSFKAGNFFCKNWDGVEILLTKLNDVKQTYSRAWSHPEFAIAFKIVVESRNYLHEDFVDKFIRYFSIPDQRLTLTMGSALHLANVMIRMYNKGKQSNKLIPYNNFYSDLGQGKAMPSEDFVLEINLD